MLRQIRSLEEARAQDAYNYTSSQVLVNEQIDLNLTTSVYPASLINLNLEFTRSSEDITKVYLLLFIISLDCTHGSNLFVVRYKQFSSNL